MGAGLERGASSSVSLKKRSSSVAWLGEELEHERARLGEGEGQLADGLLARGGEDQASMRGVANVLDPRLGPAHATGALVVTGPQPVAVPSLAAKLRQRALVRDPAAGE